MMKLQLAQATLRRIRWNTDMMTLGQVAVTTDGFLQGWRPFLEGDDVEIVFHRGRRATPSATLAEWHKKLAVEIADRIVSGRHASVNWGRAHEKLALQKQLDLEMSARGWTVLAPGVYRRPSDAS